MNYIVLFADNIALFLGIIGAMIILIGSFIAVFDYMRSLFHHHTEYENTVRMHIDPIRVEFGRYINFGLEFFIAKDLLETIFTTTWTQIGQLFAVVAIRTIISYFIIYEVDKIEGRIKKKKKQRSSRKKK